MGVAKFGKHSGVLSTGMGLHAYVEVTSICRDYVRGFCRRQRCKRHHVEPQKLRTKLWDAVNQLPYMEGVNGVIKGIFAYNEECKAKCDKPLPEGFGYCFFQNNSHTHALRATAMCARCLLDVAPSDLGSGNDSMWNLLLRMCRSALRYPEVGPSHELRSHKTEDGLRHKGKQSRQTVNLTHEDVDALTKWCSNTCTLSPGHERAKVCQRPLFSVSLVGLSESVILMRQ
eukprot:4871108-Amphidinium_carterae.1